MPGHDIHEIGELDPEDAQALVEEFGFGFGVAGDGGGPGDGKSGADGLGHLVAALAPEAAALGEGEREAGPGGVCFGDERGG